MTVSKYAFAGRDMLFAHDCKNLTYAVRVYHISRGHTFRSLLIMIYTLHVEEDSGGLR